MGMVDVTVNGKRQQLQCDDGQEPRLKKLAGYVDGCVSRLFHQHGPMPESKAMLLTSLQIADELADALEEIRRLKAGGAPGTAPRGEEDAAAAVQRVAERLEQLAAALERT